jgi:hypothetical protein
MALPDGIVDVDEPNVDGPKTSCGGDRSWEEEVAGAGAEVVTEVENRRLDEGERTLSAEEVVDKEESGVRETEPDVRYVEWVAVAFAAAAKHGAGGAFVWVFAIDKKLEMEPDNALVVAEPEVDAEKSVGAEEVDVEEVVIVEGTGVTVAAVVEVGAVEVVEAARTVPLKAASEVVPEGGVLPVVGLEMLEVDQTLGVQAGDGAESGAVKERAGGGVSRIICRIGFLNSCEVIS